MGSPWCRGHISERCASVCMRAHGCLLLLAGWMRRLQRHMPFTGVAVIPAVMAGQLRPPHLGSPAGRPAAAAAAVVAASRRSILAVRLCVRSSCCCDHRLKPASLCRAHRPAQRRSPLASARPALREARAHAAAWPRHGTAWHRRAGRRDEIGGLSPGCEQVRPGLAVRCLKSVAAAACCSPRPPAAPSAAHLPPPPAPPPLPPLEQRPGRRSGSSSSSGGGHGASSRWQPDGADAPGRHAAGAGGVAGQP